MKEIHAYLNEDGTYRVEGVVRVADNEEVRDAAFNISRAKITISPIADANRELMSLTVENNANEKNF
jgi:hypothetical protein